MFDLRAMVIATSLILASIAVAAAETAPEQPAKAAVSTTDTTSAARPIRVVLPAPWEPAPASSGAQTVVQK
ncbi:hypothetical protein [uncultured Bradyrhizobium sp.]|uniref:hypothetical protein n=1 Tax=uncultured Bradyrhizobium sp. TaxID=199684 RepID=UPI0026280C4F|nr:hypothetical protein [uncultured Bradyrhizobium sp.]